MRALLRSFALPLLAGLLLLATGGQAQAGTIIFALNASPAPVAPGGTFTVDVYLEETDGSVLATDGIIAADFKVTFSNATFSDVASNAAFDLVDITPGSGEVAFSLLTLLNPAAKSDPATPEMLWLGSVELIAGESGFVSAGVQILTPGLDNVVTGTGEVLDAGLGTPALRVGIVPEPAAILMMSLGGFAGLGVIRHQRRRAA